MQYTSNAVSTLFVKVRMRQSPYANKAIALRITAHFYEDFKPSNAQYIRELSTKCNMQDVQLVVAQLQQQANAAHVRLDVPQPLLKRLSKGA